MRKLLLSAAFLALSAAAHAQAAIGVSLTAEHIAPGDGTTPAATWVYGPTVFVQSEHGKVVKLGFDFRGSFLNGSGTAVNSVAVGPRIAFAPPHFHAKLYAAVLIGGVYVRPATGRLFTGHIDNLYLVGLDHSITPHLDWRVLEYAYSRILATGGFANEDIRNQLSTGILFRF